MEKFYPVKQEKIALTLRLPIDKLKLIDNLSGNLSISRNEFLVKCIDYALENFDKNKNSES